MTPRNRHVTHTAKRTQLSVEQSQLRKTDSQLQNLHYQGPLGILMVNWSFRIFDLPW